MTDDRAIRALLDVVAVERLAPGLVRVVSWSDAYVVDARDGGCNCPDNEYNLAPDEPCKHRYAATLATTDTPAPWTPTDSLTTRGGDAQVMTDGGDSDRCDHCGYETCRPSCPERDPRTHECEHGRMHCPIGNDMARRDAMLCADCNATQLAKGEL